MSDPGGAITPLGDGAFRVERADGTHVIAYGAVQGEKTWLFVDGITHTIEPVRHRRSSSAGDASALAAPMPATVTQVHVAVGQRVSSGDLLVTLEAMKMELPIRATSDGTVAAINCRAGELVQPGTPLIELQPEPEP